MFRIALCEVLTKHDGMKVRRMIGSHKGGERSDVQYCKIGKPK